MFTRRLPVVLCILILTFVPQATAQEIRVAPLKQDYLRDDVGVFDREQRQEIINLLEKHNRNHLGRVYVDILPNLPEGKTIERYAYDRLNEQPRLSNERADKIMLVVAFENKAVRIETSRDVQAILTDEYCHKVNREVIIPELKRGEYYKGIKAGIIAIIKKLKGM